MDKQLILVICVVLIAYLLILLIRAVSSSYRRDILFIKRELLMARGESDTRFWKRRLRCARLYFLTGVSPEWWENLFSQKRE